MKMILLVLITFSLSYAEFTRSNGMVTDSVTSLIWQDNAISEKMEWQVAIDYCEALTLGGSSDWRLPNINELISIVDETSYSPAISNVFLNVKVMNSSTYPSYWSSTTEAGLPSEAWTVEFDSGSSSTSWKIPDVTYVRCVRGGQ